MNELRHRICRTITSGRSVNDTMAARYSGVISRNVYRRCPRPAGGTRFYNNSYGVRRML